MEQESKKSLLDTYYDTFYDKSSNMEQYLNQYKVNHSPISTKIAKLVKLGELDDLHLELHAHAEELANELSGVYEELESAQDTIAGLEEDYHDLTQEYYEYTLND